MTSRSIDWDRFVTKIVEHLGANPKDVIAGSATMHMSGGDQSVTFTCSFLIPHLELTKIQQQVKEIAKTKTRIELVDKVEETLRLFTAEDPTRNIAIAVANTILKETA